MREFRTLTINNVTYPVNDAAAVKSASYNGTTLDLKDSDGNTVSSVNIQQGGLINADQKIRLDIACTDNVYSPENLPTTPASYTLKKATILPKSTAPTQDTSYEDAWNKEMVDIMTSITRTNEHTAMYDLPYLADYLDIRLLYGQTSGVDNVPGVCYPSGINYVGSAFTSGQNKYRGYGQFVFTIAHSEKIIELLCGIDFNFTYDGTTFTDGTYSVTTVSKNVYSLDVIQ